MEMHLVGPFDFQHTKQQHQEQNHINECYWNELTSLSNQVNVTNLLQVMMNVE